MRLLILLNILLSFWTKFNETGIKNRIKAEAETAYTKKDFRTAINNYKKLIEQYKVTDDKVLLNIANASFTINDTASARYYYQKITRSKSPDISSAANLQLGILEAMQRNYETALKYFRESLKYYSGNENARYNYELVLKLIQKEESSSDKKSKEEDKNNEESSGGNTPLPSRDGSEGEQQEMEQSNAGKKLNLSGKGFLSLFKQKKEAQKNEQRPEQKGNKESDIMVSNRLKKYHLNEARAKALLDAMKEEEVQYIQQRKKYQQ